MSRRERLEEEIKHVQERIKEAPIETPVAIRALWEKELGDLEFELNNLVDDREEDIQ